MASSNGLLIQLVHLESTISSRILDKAAAALTELNKTFFIITERLAPQ